jgi:hypothetical protein
MPFCIYHGRSQGVVSNGNSEMRRMRRDLQSETSRLAQAPGTHQDCTGYRCDACSTHHENKLIERIALLCKSLSIQGRKRVIHMLTEKNQEDQKEGEIP